MNFLQDRRTGTIRVFVGLPLFSPVEDRGPVDFLMSDLHQRGAGPPTGAGSVFRAGRVFTLARVHAQFHFTGAPFRGTGSLIYEYQPISVPYSCGRIAP